MSPLGPFNVLVVKTLRSGHQPHKNTEYIEMDTEYRYRDFCHIGNDGFRYFKYAGEVSWTRFDGGLGFKA